MRLLQKVNNIIGMDKAYKLENFRFKEFLKHYLMGLLLMRKPIAPNALPNTLLKQGEGLKDVLFTYSRQKTQQGF